MTDTLHGFFEVHEIRKIVIDHDVQIRIKYVENLEKICTNRFPSYNECLFVTWHLIRFGEIDGQTRTEPRS